MPRVASTSRVFEAAIAARDRLRAADLPRRASMPDVPVPVSLAQSRVNTHPERVTVIPQIGDDATIDDAAAPGHRLESFTITVVIETGFYDDEDAAVSRVAELADAVQRAFFDESPNLPVVARLTSASVDLDRIQSVQFSVYEAEPGQFTADASVEYAVRCMI